MIPMPGATHQNNSSSSSDSNGSGSTDSNNDETIPVQGQ